MTYTERMNAFRLRKIERRRWNINIGFWAVLVLSLALWAGIWFAVALVGTTIAAVSVWVGA